MFKALDLTINSLESGSVVGKLKRQKTGCFFSLFPRCGAWSQAKSLTTVTLFCFAYGYYYFWKRVSTKMKVYFDLSSDLLETAS